MGRKKTVIPIHTLETAHGEGIAIRRLRAAGAGDIYQPEAHRDDHYLFLLVESGSCRFMIDFEQYEIRQGEIIYVYPGQVHACVHADHVQATALSLAPEQIPAVYSSALEAVNGMQQPLLPDISSIGILTQGLQLLEQLLEQPADRPFRQQMLNGGIDICTGIITGAYKNARQVNNPGSRPEAIMRQFKALLVNNYLTLRTPSAYAAALHISATYLSEIVTAQSGFTVNHWIHEQLMLEARRRLYHTDDTIKEIAHGLGYEDHAYFSRLFRKKTGITPQQFRAQSRK
ncbi:AraC family transcriptional regulator [Chitinophaga varians]|uniref:AraC family transcriptional regulator n=1 Tax=Chitinophaga varians TaxID=2202339 RepID=A0A847RM91_9BACT|nr:AraC family transcriptional regulator [Chitinophaga varians]NLR68119.1 AraC family transcriptional regulator [Chitinophaga varians]